MALTVHPVTSETDLEVVRELCRAFRALLMVDYAAESDVVEGYYAEATFEALLADLARLHAPPGGQIYLAWLNGKPVGCAMFNGIDESQCELKRMFVSDSARGHGAGRALALAAIRDATAAGYTMMKLDTAPRLMAAHALYRDLGFTPTEPAPSLPKRLQDFLVFMQRPLTDADLVTG